MEEEDLRLRNASPPPPINDTNTYKSNNSPEQTDPASSDVPENGTGGKNDGQEEVEMDGKENGAGLEGNRSRKRSRKPRSEMTAEEKREDNRRSKNEKRRRAAERGDRPENRRGQNDRRDRHYDDRGPPPQWGDGRGPPPQWGDGRGPPRDDRRYDDRRAYRDDGRGPPPQRDFRDDRGYDDRRGPDIRRGPGDSRRGPGDDRRGPPEDRRGPPPPGGYNNNYGPPPPHYGNNSRGGPPVPRYPQYRVVEQPPDERIVEIMKAAGGEGEESKFDPRGEDTEKRMTSNARHKAKQGRGATNTESFDPASTLVRPDFRVIIGNGKKEMIDREIKHDDVIVVPETFCDREDWDIYYKLVEEMVAIQKKGGEGTEWISWAEGAHLITQQPKDSPTFKMVVDKMIKYFNLKEGEKNHGTRFNWYRDSGDWKPIHHDSAAFNPRRAKTQNITIGASFGASRELCFYSAKRFENGERCKVYFPQDNGMMFSFGRDVNLRWKHGINALSPEDQTGKGRISIILWGYMRDVKEEDGSPPMLPYNRR